ncbi:TPA: site-specific DNA-methyltransferase [Streptococcus suis]|uniref:DNA methyltransferase n=1 Tax=Streptococcus suis TaxID=1307 RepID=UPI002AACD21A|nr:site-specific DNA-methyltransferase [Streptococcus suis]HEM5936814.1 site-specific DNA-methyltransferase [Streptococcus suis]HEM5940927.1 site-specific DNA-methyltransferase [Streptococcus suis]HEM5947269.1 site-specific DNA-methyltransferase [Streptococcus suis]HEM5951467.1 site-specific DNA-methyltransferase [Streptococcus suis]
MKQELEQLLAQNDTFMVEGVLNKNKLAELARQYNPELLNILMSNDKISKHFFSTLDTGVLVFKKDVFLQFLNNKEFLPDSFTAYKTKIGLATGDKYLSENQEVVLNFPYKDCVLEGGQTKDDAKRQEIFFNETLAPTEINRLLDDKVLTNFKRYDETGEHEVEELNDTDNLIIKGNNLIALHSLKKRYKGSVKVIYIDVPYYFRKNIGDAFQYNSNFKMSTWLVFLKNRLEVAKQLLREDGSIWIHTGEDGMHYLKVLADAVFGQDKFVGTLPRKVRDGKSDVPFNFSQDFDWVLVYTKGFENQAIVGRQVERKYYETPDFPNRPWRTADLTSQRTIIERPNSDFTMVNPKTGKEYPVNPKRSWAVTKDTFDEWYQSGGIGFPDDYDFMKGERPFRRVFRDEDLAKSKPAYASSDTLLKDFITDLLAKTKNKDGNDEITELFSRDDFSYAKPEKLIKDILQVSSQEGDIVLDFFLGSGTTAAVAHKMNRQYIGIEQMDYIETVSVERLKKVIAGEQGGISKDVNWSGGGSFVYAELKNDAQDFKNAIFEATTTEELLELFELAKKSSFLSYRIDPKKLKKNEFEKFSLAEQKQILSEIIDNNNLYVNYSDIDDSDYQISAEDKKLNHSFYGKEK